MRTVANQGRVSRATVWIVAIVFLVIIAGVRTWASKSSTALAVNNPISQYLRFDAAHLQFGRASNDVRWLASKAPSFDHAYFGQKSQTAFFRHRDLVIKSAFEVESGKLFVIYSNGCVKPYPGCESYHVGELESRQVVVYPLPAKAGRSGYESIYWSLLSSNRIPVVDALDFNSNNHVFALGGQGTATELTAPQDHGLASTGEFTLLDGSTCRFTPNDSSTTVLWAIHGTARPRPLLTKLELSNATNGFFPSNTIVGLNCRHFAGWDLLVLQSGQALIYRLSGGHLTAISRGRPAFVGHHNMLIQEPEVNSSGFTGWTDYLWVTSTV